MRPIVLVGLIIVAAVSAVTPLRSQTRLSAMSHVQVTVAGTNDEWTPTTLTAAVGDLLLVRAEGRVRIGQVMGEVGPEGTPAGAGALQLKIGTGAGQRVGVRVFIVAGQAGEVKLRVADSRYDDNAGSFVVSVILIPAGAIPAPRPVGSPGEPQVLAPSAAEGPYVAQVRSDLRNLVAAEESFFADSARYSNALAALRFSPSQGVTVKIEGATGLGWNATATHSRLPGLVCAIFVGAAPPLPPSQNEGEPACIRR